MKKALRSLPLSTLGIMFFLATTLSAAAQTYLYSQAQFTTGKNPGGVVTADFNKDGLPDLAVANFGDNTVSILLNASRGKFQPKVDFPVASASWITTGDFNKDGNLDLAVVGFSGSLISVLLGNGDGTFQPFTTFSAPNSAEVFTADLNHDGKLDLITTNGFSGLSLSVLLGNGDGTFQSHVDYSTINAPFGVVVGDFNQDGKLDLVTVENIVLDVSLPAVDIFLGNGDGTFQPGKVIDGNSFGVANFVVGGDFNHDGKLDVAISDYNGNTGQVEILFGDGSGGFSFGPVADSGTGGLSPITAVDVNGDGNLDLIGSATETSHSGYIAVLLGNSDGTFQNGLNFGGGFSPQPPPVADFNGDGKLDAVFANENCPIGNHCPNGTVTVLLGNGQGSFAPLHKRTTGVDSEALGAADFNKDGKTDLAVVSQTTSAVLVSLSPNGAFTKYPTGFDPTGVAGADLNHDGFPDLAVSTPCGISPTCNNGGTVDVLLNNGDGTFAPAVHYRAGVLPEAVAVGDFNGDGNPDLVVPNYNNHASSTVTVLLNRGDGTFAAPTSYAVGVDPLSVTVGDFNSDGKLDLAVANNNDELAITYSILLGNGDGTFQAAQSYSSGGFSANSIATGDMNGDGKLDLVISNNSGLTNADNISVALGNGDGTFQTPLKFEVPDIGPGSLIVADFNGDGKLDVAAQEDFSTLLVYLGNGVGGLKPPLQYIAPNVRGITAGDFNGDHKLDIAVSDASTTDNSVILYLSTKP